MKIDIMNDILIQSQKNPLNNDVFYRYASKTYKGDSVYILYKINFSPFITIDSAMAEQKEVRDIYETIYSK